MTMDASRLWAKSKADHELEQPSMFLPGHLEDVHSAAERVLEGTADAQLTALGLELPTYSRRLSRCVLLAAAVHDLGKANDHFQGMLLRHINRRDRPQGLRHEWVTVLMLATLRSWLLPAVGDSETDFAIVEWAVAGHHPAHDHASPPRTPPAGAGVELRLQFDHNDFRSALEWIQTTFQLSTPPAQQTNPVRPLIGPGHVFAELGDWAKDAKRRWGKLEAADKTLVAAVKNSLIAADVAGSAISKTLPNDPTRWRWIMESFADRPESGDLESVVTERRKGFKTTELQREQFQNAVANSPERVTFVKAGCGSGKTLAAYMWAARNHPTRRLYFCYPTTGTSTEGFKDYLFDDTAKLPLIGAKLFHSRREVDFEIVLNVQGDRANSDADTALRIDALDAWSTPVAVCTVDTVLGVMQNNKRGLFAWPALAQSAFVFDEIHAYDDRLFGALLRFLSDLPGLPVLLMTASLPDARHRALQAAARTLIPIPGPADLEGRKRYQMLQVPENDPLGLVYEKWQSGGKVLWVCNTVKRVMEAADRAKQAGLKPQIYHSRFKYEDRVRRHKDVIDAFKGTGPALAICSQVAEMSLDLSADLLVSDLAPVPALIQRLGRLNRRAEKDDPWPFVVITPEQHLPYTEGDLVKAQAWLVKLGNVALSQRDLATAWEQRDDQSPDRVASAWLDGGPTTTVTELREVSPGITVLMCEDLTRVRANRRELGKFTLPMPQTSLPWQVWPRERGIPVAPPGSIKYDAQSGAKWNA
jgi:CRISPR-associated endonuclease/helicase Cas3